ncbi:MAG: GNAT family N-acetyltransferase [Candidatus Micrarchaeota archaeon]
MTRLVIRKAREPEYAEIKRLYDDHLPGGWWKSKEAFNRRMLANPPAATFVAIKEGKIIGAISGKPQNFEDLGQTFYVTGLATDRTEPRLGKLLGTRIVAHAHDYGYRLATLHGSDEIRDRLYEIFGAKRIGPNDSMHVIETARAIELQRKEIIKELRKLTQQPSE